MKTVFATLTIAISVIALSCHRKQLVTSRISCCPQGENAAIAPGISPFEAQSSIYRLPGKWTDQHNHNLELNQLKGKVQVIAMIFTHCAYACPRIVQDMKVYTEKDGEQIAYVDRVTPTPGSELTILQQLLGNLGKFNTDKLSKVGTPGGGGSAPTGSP